MFHACGNISVAPECSNKRTGERAQLLAAMIHPSAQFERKAKLRYAKELSISN